MPNQPNGYAVRNSAKAGRRANAGKDARKWGLTHAPSPQTREGTRSIAAIKQVVTLAQKEVSHE